MSHAPYSVGRTGAAFLLFGALLGGPALAAGDAGTPEELATARAVYFAHEAMGSLRALPGGCPAAGRGLVEVASVFQEANLPAPEGGTQDGWDHPLLAWCEGAQWAVISKGADGLLAPGAYAELPEVAESGDDFVMIDEQQVYLPQHVERLMQAGRQKRTMADMRSVAIVIEAYRVDNESFPGGPTARFVPVETIRDSVQPAYVRELPVEDGWGNPIWIWSDGTHYRIVSAGRDGVIDADYSTVAGAGTTSTLDSDIVIADGHFTQAPADDPS